MTRHTKQIIIRIAGFGCLLLLLGHVVKHLGWLELPGLELHPIVSITGVLIWWQAEMDWRS